VSESPDRSAKEGMILETRIRGSSKHTMAVFGTGIPLSTLPILES
jgi:hypothetical protein